MPRSGSSLHTARMLLRLVRATANLLRASVMTLFRSRDLALENLALRQQLASVCRRPHSRPDRFDRFFWSLLAAAWPRWKGSLRFVLPATVVRWHRQGFRLYWRFKSSRLAGRPPVDKEIRDLIAKMAQENPTWGEPRVHGELLKLGLHVSHATVGRYLRDRRSPTLRTWGTFLRLHLDSSVGIDFFDLPTATFDVLRGFLVADHVRRQLLHVAVTRHPTAEWTANQMNEAFPFDTAPRFLFRDRDAIFGGCFGSRVERMGITEVVSAPRCPWQKDDASYCTSFARFDTSRLFCLPI